MAVHDLIERVQVLKIDPDDVLVVRVDPRSFNDPDTLEALADAWRDAMPGQRILVVSGDLDLEVIRAEHRRPLGYHQPGECDECDSLRARELRAWAGSADA